MSHVKALFHIVFSTKNRLPALNAQHRNELFSYICGIAINKSCHPYIVNGVDDHLHMLVDLHSTVSLSDFVKEIKRCSSIFLRDSKQFPLFSGWEREYAAFSCSESHKGAVIDYIKTQEMHHKKVNSFDELQHLLSRNF